MNSKGKPAGFELEDLGIHIAGIDNGFKNDDDISKNYTKAGTTPMSNFDNKMDQKTTVERPTPNTAEKLIENTPPKQVEN